MLITYCGKRSGAAHVVICDIAAVTVMNMPGDVRTALCPNITGYLEGRRMSQYGSRMFPNVGGSFYYQQDTTANDRAEITMHDVAAPRDNYYFSASASNSAYSGSGVQPKAIQTLIIIKI